MKTMNWQRVTILAMATAALIASGLVPDAAYELRALAAALLGWALPTPGK